MKNEIINNEIKDTVEKDGFVYVKYNISYPVLKDEKHKEFSKKFNSFYETLGERFGEFAKTTLLKKAISIKTDDFVPFGAVMRYICAYDNNEIVSIVTDLSVFSGGQGVETKRLSQNWHRDKNRLLVYEDFFSNEEKKTIIMGICEEVKLRIATERSAFFSDYEKRISKKFEKNNFYLTPKGYGFFYPSGTVSESKNTEVFFLLGYRGKGKINPY